MSVLSPQQIHGQRHSGYRGSVAHWRTFLTCWATTSSGAYYFHPRRQNIVADAAHEIVFGFVARPGRGIGQRIGRRRAGFPDSAEGLVEEFELFVARQQQAREGPVDIVAMLDADEFERARRRDQAVGSDGQTGRAQDADEAHEGGGERHADRV